jgi:hypothetical protein
MKTETEEYSYSKHKLINENKLDLIVLLIPKLSFPSTN